MTDSLTKKNEIKVPDQGPSQEEIAAKKRATELAEKEKQAI